MISDEYRRLRSHLLRLYALLGVTLILTGSLVVLMLRWPAAEDLPPRRMPVEADWPTAVPAGWARAAPVE